MEDDKLNSDLENEEEYLEEEEFEEGEYEIPPRRRANAIFIVLMIGFFLTSGVLAYIWYMEREETKQLTAAKDTFQAEKDSLLNIIDTLGIRLDSLNGTVKDKDWEITELQKENNDIKYKLSRVRNEKAKLNKYKAQIAELNARIEEYKVKIVVQDSLNRQMSAQLTNAQKQVDQQKEENFEMSARYDKLNSKAEEAAVLKALNISIITVDKKNKPSGKAKKIKSIRVNSTIGGNPLIDPGTKDIYLRLIKATQILSTSSDNLFTVDGAQIIYTDKGTIDYVNEDEDVSFKYKATIELKPGAYSAEIYADGRKIGNQRFKLE